MLQSDSTGILIPEYVPVFRVKVSKLKVSELETKGILRLKVAIDDQIWSPLQL